MPALDTVLRNRLENTVKQARDLAEKAALAGLTALGVASPSAPAHLTEPQRQLRTKLRARGKQLGDERQTNGTQDLTHLVWDTAYEHWHQMLFARFLAENRLLMHPVEKDVALTLDDCRELVADPAEARGATTAAQLAAVFATAMLPQIFRPQDPVLAVPFAPEHQKPLEKLVEALPAAVFTAEDSLGWVYQFWQAKRKDEVNASEVKIGADELPAVTQLFTEPYMVQFLLHNSLGAWWAAKRIPPALWTTAASEDELRTAAAQDLPGYAFTYLRFVRGEDGKWQPAAGTFPTWPVQAKNLKTLDPCCGSGHFLVALLHLLARFRMVEERLEPRAAVNAVLRNNLHGLEIDPRCTQIAAFAIALAAWTFPGSGGHRPLPAPHIACSGLRVAARREEWMAIADRVPSADRERLRQGMGRLWDVFQQAPVLGSLLDPGQATEQGDLFTAGWAEVQPLLAKALSDERVFDTEERAEIGVAARGLADAAQIMSQAYHLIATNVPYKVKGGLCDILQVYLEKNFKHSRSALETAFLEHCLGMTGGNGFAAVVLPQNWLFQKGYVNLRKKLLETARWSSLAILGRGAFSTPLDVAPILLTLARAASSSKSDFVCYDVSSENKHEDKAAALRETAEVALNTHHLLENPDHKITPDELSQDDLLTNHAFCYQGLRTGDKDRFVCYHWEIKFHQGSWDPLRSPTKSESHYGGMTSVLFWQNANGDLHTYAKLNRDKLHDMHESGNLAWGHLGIAFNEQGLATSIYRGEKFDASVMVVFPKESNLLDNLATRVLSTNFKDELRKLDRKRSITNATYLQVHFKPDEWLASAQSLFPHGLPRPYTNDLAQWIFHGHPCGSVIWSDTTKRTAHGPIRRDDTVLSVALARLLGYRWPAELDPAMDLADEQRAWVSRCADLLTHADADGIVAIAALATERPAAERLRDLLAAAYGKDWSPAVETELLAHDGTRTLDDWLRDKAFARHVELFQNRPFVWHIWDGRKDGFHAFVNYHKLDNRLLERLIHTYLQEWIDRQNHDAKAGKAGADLRLASAQELHSKLEAIHQGEAPNDIFVRWRPLHEQPIGWNPDLNDGVRLNIRPWITADVLRVPLKTKIKYGVDRGKDPDGSAWGPERDNDRHLSLAEKHAARAEHTTKASKGTKR